MTRERCCGDHPSPLEAEDAEPHDGCRCCHDPGNDRSSGVDRGPRCGVDASSRFVLVRRRAPNAPRQSYTRARSTVNQWASFSFGGGGGDWKRLAATTTNVRCHCCRSSWGGGGGGGLRARAWSLSR